VSATVDQPQSRLLFDVACRVRERPAFLGGTYRINAVSFDTPAPVIALPVGNETVSSANVRNEGELLVVDVPCECETPATIRWKYAMPW
jgi:hypothetical protein